MKPIPLRWVDINKGSETSKEYRSRLVVMETERRSTIAPEDKGAVFSAAPPLEAVRMLASLAMSIKGPITQHDPDSDIVIGFLDISRAHPHMEMKRELYTASLWSTGCWPEFRTQGAGGQCWSRCKTWSAPPLRVLNG